MCCALWEIRRTFCAGERHRHDRTRTARHTHELLRKSTAAASEFQDALSREQMDKVPEGLRAPQQAVVDDGIVPLPIAFAEELAVA